MITGDGIVVAGLVVVVVSLPCSKLVSSAVVVVADFVVDTTSLVVVVVISFVVVTIGASVTLGGDCDRCYWLAVIIYDWFTRFQLLS